MAQLVSGYKVLDSLLTRCCCISDDLSWKDRALASRLNKTQPSENSKSRNGLFREMSIQIYWMPR